MFSLIREDETLKWGKVLDHNKGKRGFLPFYLFCRKNLASCNRKSKIHSPKYKQRVTIKVSYTRQRSKESVANNTKSAVAYAYKLDGIDGFSAKSNSVSEKEAQNMLEGKKVFKLVISPENEKLATHEFAKVVMKELEHLIDRKLVWVGTVHNDTDHKHIHVLISREDGDGLDFEHPLYIDPNIIKKDLREKAMNVATLILGYVNETEINKKQFFEIEQNGYTSLDTSIGKNISSSGYFSDKSLNRYPKNQRKYISKRLKYLEKLNIGISRGNDGYIFEKDWKTHLYTLRKVADILPEIVSKDDFKKVVVAKDQKISERHTITGQIIAKKAVDELNDRIGFIVKSSSGKLYYHEQIMDWKKYQEMKVGTNVKLSWKGIKNKKVNKSYEILDMETEL